MVTEENKSAMGMGLWRNMKYNDGQRLRGDGYKFEGDFEKNWCLGNKGRLWKREVLE